ncbi:MAG: DUF4190 domain-containing protein [Phycisphaerales bacterium]|nr:DUF4190 domain-containing protein [Phycisphaerales bacterium]
MSEDHAATTPTHTQHNAIPQERPLSQLALWSMILGILTLCFGPFALIPLIMGIVGIITTGADKSKRGLGFAIAGTVLGVVGLLGTIILLLIGTMVPALGAARERAQQLKSSTQVRSQLQAAIIYANNNDDQFPPVDQWPDLMYDQGLLEPEILVSPLEDGDGISYIYLGGWNSFNAQEIVIYEDPKHHQDFVIVGFADGHVEEVPHDRFEELLFNQTGSQSP